MSAEAGSPPPLISTGMSPWITARSTRPTTTVLDSAFTPCQAACIPKVRLRPSTGLNWSNLPLNFLKWMPPCAAAVTSTAIVTTESSGRMMPPTEPSPSTSACIACVGSGWSITVRSWYSGADVASAPADTVAGIITAATPMATQAVRSWDLESCPFSRTSFMRFSVASSVFSPESASGIATSPP